MLVKSTRGLGKTEAHTFASKSADREMNFAALLQLGLLKSEITHFEGKNRSLILSNFLQQKMAKCSKNHY